MTATFEPFGFSDITYEGGKTSYTLRPYPLSTTGMAANLGAGDAVTFSNSGSSISGLQQMANTTNSTFSLTATQAFIAGVVVEFRYTTPQNQKVVTNYWAANTPTLNSQPPMVVINHLPNTLFSIQANAPFPACGAYGQNCNVVNNGATVAYTPPNASSTTMSQPNPATGNSTQFLIPNITPGQPGTGVYSGQCKIVDLLRDSTAFPNNNWTDLYPIVLVRFNMHFNSAPTPSTK